VRPDIERKTRERETREARVVPQRRDPSNTCNQSTPKTNKQTTSANNKVNAEIERRWRTDTTLTLRESETQAEAQRAVPTKPGNKLTDTQLGMCLK